jgi:hypothetical protein
MTENNLSKLLERAGDRMEVGVPPIEGMIAAATRLRRRRALAVTFGSVAAVVMAIGGTALLASSNGSVEPEPPAASPTGMMTPPGTRLVGIGAAGAAIAVPTEWGTNAIHCAAPRQDTVLIDVESVELCGFFRPPGVESVELRQGAPPFDYEMDMTTVIDGVPAERQDTTCEPSEFRTGTLCTGTIYIPSLGVSFRAESSTSAAEVDRILEWIRVVPNRVAVPGYQAIVANYQGRAQETYVEALRMAGLTAEIQTRKVPAADPGYILGVSPAPGTMLQPGAVVTVTVVAES